MSLVAIIKCDSYDESIVYESVQRGINLLGGIERFSLSGEKILLKPNLITGADPKQCITTHPAVFKAVAQMFQSAGAKVSYGDNPGIMSPALAAKKAGISKIARMLNIDSADFIHVKRIHFDRGKQNKVFNIVNAVFQNDGVISLPKFKTHGFTKITGSVKNQFGCLPFIEKRFFHAKLPDAGSFAKMLLDLNQYIRPRLYIMDGIYAMEGSGPLSGNPKRLNVLGFSADPIALDSVMCEIINLDPYIVPTNFYGQQFNYGECEKNKIKLVGDNVNELINSEFNVERTRDIIVGRGYFSRIILHSLIKKPVIINNNCNNCGNCILACPVFPKAIKIGNHFNNEIPYIDYDLCIRCYCCHELCSNKAIKLKIPAITKLLSI